MDDSLRVSDRALSVARGRSTALWWTFWLLFLVISNVINRRSISPGDDPHLGVSPALEAAAAVALLVAVVPWLTIIRRITKGQRDLIENATA